MLGELDHWQAFLLSESYLKNIIVAGEQLILSDELRKVLRISSVKLHNHYGPAETHVATMITLDHSSLTAIPSIGRPISNTQLYILDAYHRPVGIGVTGELYIAGAGLARGY